MSRLLNRKLFVNTLGAAGLGLGMLATTVGAPSAMAQEGGSQGVDLQLLQDEGELDLSNLSDEELKQLLIQLLQEKVGEKDGALAFQSDEEAKDVVIARLQDGEGELGGRERVRDIFVQRLQESGEDGPLAQHEEMREEVYAEFTQALADELGIDDADEVDAAIRIAMMSVVDSHVGDGMLTEGKAEALKALIATADVPFPGMGGFGPHHGGRFFIAAHGPGFGHGGEGMGPGHEAIAEWIGEKRDEARAGDGEERGRASNDSEASSDDDSQVDEEQQG